MKNFKHVILLLYIVCSGHWSVGQTSEGPSEVKLSFKNRTPMPYVLPIKDQGVLLLYKTENYWTIDKYSTDLEKLLTKNLAPEMMNLRYHQVTDSRLYLFFSTGLNGLYKIHEISLGSLRTLSTTEGDMPAGYESCKEMHIYGDHIVIEATKDIRVLDLETKSEILTFPTCPPKIYYKEVIYGDKSNQYMMICQQNKKKKNPNRLHHMFYYLNEEGEYVNSFDLTNELEEKFNVNYRFQTFKMAEIDENKVLVASYDKTSIFFISIFNGEVHHIDSLNKLELYAIVGSTRHIGKPEIIEVDEGYVVHVDLSKSGKVDGIDNKGQPTSVFSGLENHLTLLGFFNKDFELQWIKYKPFNQLRKVYVEGELESWNFPLETYSHVSIDSAKKSIYFYYTGHNTIEKAKYSFSGEHLDKTQIHNLIFPGFATEYGTIKTRKNAHYWYDNFYLSTIYDMRMSGNTLRLTKFELSK